MSADRVSAFISSPETVAHVMARLAGGPKELTQGIDLEEWAKQADKYDEIYNDGIWNKTLQMAVIASKSHPFAAVRVREILKWGKSEQYQSLLKNRDLKHQNTCPNCKKHIEPTWGFCKHCGYRLI